MEVLEHYCKSELMVDPKKQIGVAIFGSRRSTNVRIKDRFERTGGEVSPLISCGRNRCQKGRFLINTFCW